MKRKYQWKYNNSKKKSKLKYRNEESDSDDDFENIDENKYILKKSYTMTCIYLPQFNKWTPKSVSETNNIVLWDSIQGLKKKY